MSPLDKSEDQPPDDVKTERGGIRRPFSVILLKRLTYRLGQPTDEANP
jgi:hypothetical protein